MTIPQQLLPKLIDGAAPACIIGTDAARGEGTSLEPRTPIDGSPTLPLSACSAEQVAAAVERAAEAFRHWRLVPAPRRGELVRRIGNLVREHKRDLAKLVCLEAG